MKIIYVLYIFVAIASSRKISNQFSTRNNNFAIDLSVELSRETDKNIIHSALSLETILALTALGAKGETASQIKHSLQLPSSDEEIKSEFNIVHSEIGRFPDIFSIANQIYLAEDIAIEPTFSKIASDTFKAGIQNVDFKNETAAVNLINNWVEDKTKHKIKNLLEHVDPSTRLVLVNALYLNATWRKPFDKKLTTKKEFHITHNETVFVDTMQLTTNLPVHRSQKFNLTIVRVPYSLDGNDFTLAVVLTDDKVGEANARKNLKAIVSEQNCTPEYVTLHLPKFRIETSIDFKPILKNLGIKKLFSDADLSGISKENLHVDAIAQKVFIDVNEDGTEAASATAEVVAGYSLPTYQGSPKEYKVDRPFIFAILFDEVALLAGRVTNPLQSNL